jgi:phosphohistidine phosphatase SixA
MTHIAKMDKVLLNTENYQVRAFLRGLWQKIQRYGKMLAAVTRHIAKIRCSPAHKVAQPTQQNTQTFEAAVRFFDADAYVVAAGLLAQQAAQHSNSVVKSHAVFFRPYLEVLARSSE